MANTTKSTTEVWSSQTLTASAGNTTSSSVDLTGKEVVVVGRSNIVGKPVAMMCLAQHATVTLCHSRTKDLPAKVGQADVLIAAVGRPEMIKGDWIRPGATV